MNTKDLIRLAADLWPRWTITESIADLMVRKFEELDPACVEQAIRDHRMDRATVPDIGVIVKAAKTASDSKHMMASQQLQAQAWTPTSHDIRNARQKLSRMDEDRRLWLWRYCRELARHTTAWELVKDWPHHWSDPAPAMVDWPEQVIGAYHMVHIRLGV